MSHEVLLVLGRQSVGTSSSTHALITEADHEL
jgi:hypothetical protein